MYDFHPYFTKDGSVGLFSPEFNDIYHSATGALTEAYEKFVLPANIDYLIQTKSEIKVLDICYGIGYNTKSFLNFICDKFSKISIKNSAKKISETAYYSAPIYTNKMPITTNEYNDSIHTNKNTLNMHTCNDTIYTYNDFPKISVTCIDNDKNLMLLSPFIKTGEENYQKYNSIIPNEKIHKYLDAAEQPEILTVDKSINFLLLQSIIKIFPEITHNDDILSILYNDKFEPFFNNDTKDILKFYINNMSDNNPTEAQDTFLHNIYYNYVSSSDKRRVNDLILRNINLEFKNSEARRIILDDSNIYNLIFLDAFTPSKCPCLWSLEFFQQLFNHLEPDGMLLTYSSSAAVRGAMTEVGFHIGNIYCERENKFFGTVAVKDESLIKHPLSDFDLGLLKTRAGIFYRDENLIGQNEAIIAARNSEVKNSPRQSSSAYRKINVEKYLPPKYLPL